jgi:hypothetical protein
VYIFHSPSTFLDKDRTSKNSIKFNPRYGRVDNPNVAPKDDCALRAFTIEMAAYIAPALSKTNWATLSQSAFQMNQCNGISYKIYQVSSSTKPFKTASEMKKTVCHYTVFVHDAKVMICSMEHLKVH